MDVLEIFDGCNLASLEALRVTVVRDWVPARCTQDQLPHFGLRVTVSESERMCWTIELDRLGVTAAP